MTSSDSKVQSVTGHETREEVGRLDVIVCDSCSRSFTTADGPGMLAAIKGPCPNCGGHFRLADSPAADLEAPPSAG